MEEPTPKQEQPEVLPHKPEDIDPETGLTYQVKEWQLKYPEAQDTLSLDLEERKRFVGMYYADQQCYEEKLEQMQEESEKVIDTELELIKANESVRGVY